MEIILALNGLAIVICLNVIAAAIRELKRWSQIVLTIDPAPDGVHCGEDCPGANLDMDGSCEWMASDNKGDAIRGPECPPAARTLREEREAMQRGIEALRAASYCACCGDYGPEHADGCTMHLDDPTAYETMKYYREAVAQYEAARGEGGWYPTRFTALSLSNAFTMKPTDRTLMAMRNMYKNSWGRSRYVYGALNQAIGAIDLGFMKRLYKRSGSFPLGTIKEIRKQYNKTGEWGEYPIGHASNALVAIMKPDNGSEGYYALCVGTAARGLAPLTPTRAAPIYGETNAFWELRLADSPKEVMDKALAHEASAKTAIGNEGVYEWAKATRCFTRAQVRALQVCQALVP